MERDKIRTIPAAFCVILGLWMVPQTHTWAHHGLSAYDIDHQITLTGTVTAFLFGTR